jgi:hypothetical protein
VACRAAELTGRDAERRVLDRLVEAVRAGESRALVVQGEPGVGKTALLEYLGRSAPGCRIEHAAGVQSEMELAFAGLHQLCAQAEPPRHARAHRGLHPLALRAGRRAAAGAQPQVPAEALAGGDPRPWGAAMPGPRVGQQAVALQPEQRRCQRRHGQRGIVPQPLHLGAARDLPLDQQPGAERRGRCEPVLQQGLAGRPQVHGPGRGHADRERGQGDQRQR